jgi:hypothetical protein
MVTYQSMLSTMESLCWFVIEMYISVLFSCRKASQGNKSWEPDSSSQTSRPHHEFCYSAILLFPGCGIEVDRPESEYIVSFMHETLVNETVLQTCTEFAHVLICHVTCSQQSLPNCMGILIFGRTIICKQFSRNSYPPTCMWFVKHQPPFDEIQLCKICISLI